MFVFYSFFIYFSPHPRGPKIPGNNHNRYCRDARDAHLISPQRFNCVSVNYCTFTAKSKLITALAFVPGLSSAPGRSRLSTKRDRRKGVFPRVSRTLFTRTFGTRTVKTCRIRKTSEHFLTFRIENTTPDTRLFRESYYFGLRIKNIQFITRKTNLALIWKTHNKPSVKLFFPDLKMYRTDHPDNTARARSAVIISSKIQRRLLPTNQTHRQLISK